MPDNHQQSGEASGQGGWFPPTRWTDILAARQSGSPEAEAALNRLCGTYWYPLYAYIRRRGHPTEQAQDLTQSFFHHVLERNLLGSANRARGKFRSFLLASLNYFLANTRDFEQAKKRGGGALCISLDEKSSEERYALEPVSELSPEKLFERNWAMTVLEQARTKLRQDYARQGKSDLFDRLRPFLAEETGSGDYVTAAKDLGMTAGAVTTAVHRLRHRYAEILDAEIGQTVASPEEIEGERRYLYEVLSRR